jgi:hypothetical protein
MSFYQYEPPVAMFSMAEVDKYNRYEGSGMALFATEPAMVRVSPPGPKKLTGYGKQVRGVIRGVSGAASGTAGAVSGASRSVGMGTGIGIQRLGRGLRSAATGMGDNFVGKGVGGLGTGLNKAGLMVRKNPRLAAAAMLAGAVGAGGTMFMRRRRSKTGKMIVEQVRR